MFNIKYTSKLKLVVVTLKNVIGETSLVFVDFLGVLKLLSWRQAWAKVKEESGKREAT